MGYLFFDPLQWLTGRDILATRDADSSVSLRFRRDVPPATRQEAMAILNTWGWLLAKQLEVEPGMRPRTVRQLLASGRLRIEEHKACALHHKSAPQHAMKNQGLR